MTAQPDTAGLSLKTLGRFERRMNEALRFRSGSRERLRTALRRMVIELRVCDASDPRVERLVRFVATHEAEAFDYDRASVVTGKSTSGQLINELLTWIDLPLPRHFRG